MNITFKQIVLVGDYHDIPYICRCFPGLDLSYKELGMYEQDYVGIIYDNGQLPESSEIDDMLSKVRIKLNGA